MKPTLKIKFFIILSLLFPFSLIARETVAPLCVVGAGYCNADSRYANSLVQVEYRFGSRFIFCSRPQFVLLAPAMKAVFVGGGLGLELYTNRHLLVIPSFTPGFYYQGSGKDLGFPLEFRSCLEVAYEWTSGFRFGLQAFHISNASLSKKNPGTNSLLFTLSIPLN